MTAYVEECRREWKRLGVPDLLAEEMATDLEADLAEAEADGVSAAEILGESDPRRFAAAWASERGLVPEQPTPRKSRRRLWIWVAVGSVLLLLLVLLPALALIGGGTVSATDSHATRVLVTPPRRARVPDLVGLKICRAILVADRSGLNVHVRGGKRHPCNSIVSEQTPAPGSRVRLDARQGAVTLRLRRS